MEPERVARVAKIIGEYSEQLANLQRCADTLADIAKKLLKELGELRGIDHDVSKELLSFETEWAVMASSARAQADDIRRRLLEFLGGLIVMSKEQKPD